MSQTRFKKPEEDDTNKSCEAFILNILNTQHYSIIAKFMRQFKINQNKANALQIFINLHAYIKSTGIKSLEEEFNRCLVPEAFIEEQNKQKPKRNNINPNNQLKRKDKPQPQHFESAPIHPQNYEQVDEEVFMKRVHSLPNFNTFVKMVELYLKCIITLTQLKEFSIKILSKNLYNYFISVASGIQGPRRKGSCFVSLNQLLESQFKNRIGASYVQMPDGYANHCNDHTLPEDVKKTLNRQFVSMPLGTQFKNTKKNEYEQQMFKLEEDRFEIDSTIMNFRNCLKHLSQISCQNKFQHSNILERTLYRVYGSGEAYDLLQKAPSEVARILSFRIEEKLKQIEACRKKSMRIWEQAAIKNFQKSLDHRSYYFESHQKKYNLNPSRWDKQTEFRHQLYVNPSIQNTQSFNTNICDIVDTFEHITRQKCIQSRSVDLNFPQTNSFIRYPENKILYVYDFGNEDVLNDVIGVICSKINKKSTFQYLLLKLFKIDATKSVQKCQEDMKKFQKYRQTSNSKTIEPFDEDQYVVTKKDRKRTPDIAQQFHQIIDQDLEYANYKQISSPFQGPSDHVFIGTRSQYHFIRYLLIIYQRFIKAKQIIQTIEKEEQKGLSVLGQKYQRFKYLLINKTKDQNFDDLIRKIFDKNAFLFLTLSKLIQKAVRNINNPDQLSANILRSDTKYYDLGIKDIDKFDFQSEMQQIMRIYHQHGVFYRFSWDSPYLYISSWNSIYKQWKNRSQVIPRLNQKFNLFLSKSNKLTVEKSNGVKKRCFQEMSSEYITAPNDMLLFQKGSQFFQNQNKQKKAKKAQNFEIQLRRLKKVKQIINI